jgi:hypothetical protein
MVTRTERFWSNIRKNEKSSGHFYTSTKTALPSHSEMNEMGKYGIIYDIDPQIRNFIITLNRVGYKTEGSCAGHRKSDRGFATIQGDFNKIGSNEKKNLINLAHKNGLRNVRIYSFAKSVWYRISFDPVGIVKKNDIRKGRELES